MPHPFGSRESIAIAFSILLLGACAQKGAGPDSASTSKGTATDTAATTSTSTTTDSAVSLTPNTTTATATDTAATPSATGTDTSSTAATATATATSPTSELLAAKPGATPPAATPTPPAPAKAAPAQAPAGNGKLSLDQLPNDLPIVNVAGNLIKVTDYKRMLRLQQMQMNSALAMDPAAKARVLEMAKANKVTLTDQEKAQLFKVARGQKGTEAEYQEFLKKAGVTDEIFKNEVYETGLAFKTSNMVLEQGLLPELVNRELLAQAALEAGGEKQAMNQYFRFKASKHYNVLKEQAQFTADDIREEVVKAELAKQQLARLEKKITVTPDDLKKAYDANKAAFKHEEQVRISKILLLAPPEDVGPMKSVKAQLASSTKLTGEKLDAEVSKFMQQKRQAATLLLGQAIGGGDFAKLANQYSEDPAVKATQNGGDLGWLDLKALVPELQTAISPLKKGQVLPQVVSNPQGFIIFKVTDRRPSGYTSLADAKPLLEQKLKQEKLNAAVQGWLQKRKNVVRVEFTPNFLAMAQGQQAAQQRQK